MCDSSNNGSGGRAHGIGIDRFEKCPARFTVFDLDIRWDLVYLSSAPRYRSDEYGAIGLTLEVRAFGSLAAATND